MAKLHDSNMSWRRKRIRWDAWPDLATGLIPATVSESGSDEFIEGELIQAPRAASKTAPDISLLEVSDFGLVGIHFLDDADEMFFCKQLPYDIDPRHDIGFRINYCQTNAGTDDTLWKLKVGFDKKDVVIQAEDASTITVLETVLVVKASGGAALENLWTARGIRAATNTELAAISNDDVDDGVLMRFNLELDATNANDVHILLGIEMDYCPRWCTEANKDDAPLGWDNA